MLKQQNVVSNLGDQGGISQEYHDFITWVLERELSLLTYDL